MGKPAIINDRTLAAVPLIQAVYEESCVGGNLHVALDDWNLEDDIVQWCAGADEDSPGPLTEAEAACAAAFVSMTEAERGSALALCDGFIGLETAR